MCSAMAAACEATMPWYARGKMGESGSSERVVRPIGGLPYLAAAVPLLLHEYGAAFFPALSKHPLTGAWAGQISWMAWLGRFEASLLRFVILACCAAIGWLS